MLYSLIKFYARLAIKVYCPHVYINKPQILKTKEPLLLACNHPNSFLDGMILTTLFDQPVYSLARGDVFRKEWIRKLLLWFKLLPVYRTSEGVENLGQNYATFKMCRQTFKKGSMVLIFSEAGSTNEWHLRPLRKGTARLAISSWQQGIQLKVLPVALNYSSFKKFGKNVHIYFGDFIEQEQVVNHESTGKQLVLFNQLLQHQLKQYVYEIKSNDYPALKKTFYINQSILKTGLLALPALIGFVSHFIYYFVIKFFVTRFFKASDHYDSVLNSILILAAPLYLLACVILIGHFSSFLVAASCFLLFPFCAWAFVHIKYQFDW